MRRIDVRPGITGLAVRGLGVIGLRRCGQDSGEGPMKRDLGKRKLHDCRFAWPAVAAASILAALALAGCSTTPGPQVDATAPPPQPEMPAQGPASAIAG